MHCPTCGNEVPARPDCLNCGAALFGDPTLPATALGPVQVPLTSKQKARLLANGLPFLASILVFGGYLVLVGRELTSSPPPALWFVIVLALLATGYQAIQGLRDLISGTALMQEDLLDRSYRTGAGPNRCRGRFEKLGTLTLSRKAYFQNSPGQRYRVVYSPISKTVWALEPPDLRIRG